MASWRDRAGPATFRGVPFFADDTELSSGRRTVRHEFPFRDAAFVEDTGRRPRSFDVDGYVIGADYLVKRDALLAALEEEGPGELVHPFFGTRRVIATNVRVRESSERGGLARFGITFEETEAAPTLPASAPAVPEMVYASADFADAAIDEDFADLYDASGAPTTAMESLSAMLQSAGSAMSTALAPLVTVTQDSAALNRAIDVLVERTTTIIRAPLDVTTALRSALTTLASAPVRAATALSSLMVAYAFELGVRPGGVTDVRVREQRNWGALGVAIRATLLVQASRLAATERWKSYDDAVAARQSITDAIDDLLGSLGDRAFAAFERLRADLVKGVPGEAGDLPRIMHYTPPATVPSLVLAYRLYGDVSRELDLMARNRVFHPGFVVGGVSLEVLSRG